MRHCQCGLPATTGSRYCAAHAAEAAFLAAVWEATATPALN